MDQDADGTSIILSYFDPFDLFESIRDEFRKIFPLENVHWKSPAGSIRTIGRLPVSLHAANHNGHGKLGMNSPFINFIIVNCISVDEYRSKVRPLIRQWLPEVQGQDTGSQHELQLPSVPIIFLYANAEIIDINIFKTMSIMEKIEKDFPDVQALELKSVYKSPKEKEAFWNQLSQNIKSYLLKIFQQRLDYLKNDLGKHHGQPPSVEQLVIQERLLDLYSEFNIVDEGISQLSMIKSLLRKLLLMNDTLKLKDHKLENHFAVSSDENSQISVSESLKNGTLTEYGYHKYFFVKELHFLLHSELNATAYLKVYKLLRTFLGTIETSTLKNNVNYLNFRYSFLEFMISLVSSEKMVQSPILDEVKGELLLLKRDCWIESVLASTEFKLHGRSVTMDTQYKFDNLPKTEDDFHDKIINSSKEIIEIFSKCAKRRRQRTIDYLTIEIGLLHFQRKEYENTIILFVSSYEFYIQSNWNLIGLKILKVFIQSLLNCSNITTLQIDDASISVSDVLKNAFLNLVNLSEDLEEKILYWQKFLELSTTAEQKIIFPVKSLFNIDVDDCIDLLRPNVYGIGLHVKSIFTENFEIDSIIFKLKNSDHTITFRAFDVNIKLSTIESTIVLETNEISFGDFVPVAIEISIKGNVFVHNFPSNNNKKYISILPLYDGNNVSLHLQQARSLKLGQYALTANLNNPCNAENIHLDMVVVKEDSSEPFPITFEEDADVPYLKIQDLSFTSKKIEYFPSRQITSFKLKVTLSFDIGRIHYKEINTIEINCFLPISVSVEDIFKKSLFFFKFLLNTSIKEVPLLLHSSKLKADAETKYDLSGDFEPPKPIILRSNVTESCLNCYQIKCADKFDRKDIFHLNIKYNSLKEYLDLIVTNSFLLGENDEESMDTFKKWRLIWKNYVLDKISYDFDVFDKERTVKLCSSEAIINKIIFMLKKPAILDPDMKKMMINCIERLVIGIPATHIDGTKYFKSLEQKELSLPVELPEFDQFFFVEFVPKEPTSKVLEAGVPVPYQITIENLECEWNRSGIEKFENVFEISSSNEWLVNGKKRFLIPEQSQTVSYDVSLIPLKKGYLSFPGIEITNTRDGATRIDYVNAFDSILVL
ncbi:hypothetical protein KAFR_0B03280 [Kazachstania africana CBS 2517]|uniref:Trafficking protein particle complex subunit 11 domain-containing protein n=1 Tax=Kazachstania africana (strain ATCC 22294 / BCRC 22015 / CBS 2517 / CECT 1963 / NBRC 1671 / NRRL Y-8276) TaxID=1071382 RepID=H2AQH4_KAZAF|nr:hypothetical protein KAFR_0B03280 [Kazachstania africana CBS 2517]CCF56624.1 hypothetical protein KAFR_0B03280 [Kazachstania africana CBS 2517]